MIGPVLLCACHSDPHGSPPKLQFLIRSRARWTKAGELGAEEKVLSCRWEERGGFPPPHDIMPLSPHHTREPGAACGRVTYY